MGNACCTEDHDFLSLGKKQQERASVPVYNYPIERDIIWGDPIGEGGTAKVRTGRLRQSGEMVVVKCVRRVSLSKEEDQRVKDEVSILSSLQHPRIVKLKAYYVTKDWHYLVMEPVMGGELFQRIIEKERYTERDAQEAVRELLQAVSYMHSRGVVHRDLKPENVLLSSAERDTEMKLIDFGLATKKLDQLTGAVGSPFYVAPEVINCVPYDKKVDVWAVGVITYLILCGAPPFDGTRISQVFKQIRTADYDFKADVWREVSEEGKDFIRCALTVDPTKRATAEDLLSHPWLASPQPQSTQRLLSDAQENLKTFCARKQLRKAEFAVTAAVKLQQLVGGTATPGDLRVITDTSSPGAGPNGKMAGRMATPQKSEEATSKALLAVTNVDTSRLSADKPRRPMSAGPGPSKRVHKTSRYTSSRSDTKGGETQSGMGEDSVRRASLDDNELRHREVEPNNVGSL